MQDRRRFLAGILGISSLGLYERLRPNLACGLPGMPGRVYDVTSYGADPCRADNREAMQGCLDAATRGGVVFVPPGRYRVAGTLIIEGSEAVVLTGTGAASTLVQTGRGPTLRLRERSHVVRRLRFEADESVPRSIGVVVEPTADHARVDACEFSGLPSSAVVMQPGLTGATVVGSRCAECGFGEETRSPFDSTIRGADLVDCVIRENHLVDGANKGIDLGQAESGNDNVRIVANTIRRFENIGIGVGSGNDTMIARNYVTGCGDNAIDVNDLAGLGNRGTLVEANTCLSSKDGIFFGHGATDAEIGRNTIRACRRGIRLLDGPERVVVSDNVIRETEDDSGIEITNEGGEDRNPAQLLLHDNVVSGTGAAAVSVRGARQVVVDGCLFSEMTSEAVRATGSRGLVIRSNSIEADDDGSTSADDLIQVEDKCLDLLLDGNVLIGRGTDEVFRGRDR